MLSAVPPYFAPHAALQYALTPVSSGRHGTLYYLQPQWTQGSSLQLGSGFPRGRDGRLPARGFRLTARAPSLLTGVTRTRLRQHLLSRSRYKIAETFNSIHRKRLGSLTPVQLSLAQEPRRTIYLPMRTTRDRAVTLYGFPWSISGSDPVGYTSGLPAVSIAVYHSRPSDGGQSVKATARAEALNMM